MTYQESWTAEYKASIASIETLVKRSRLLMGGFSTCYDVYLSLRDIESVIPTAAGTPAEPVFAALVQRAHQGLGGELALDWPDGPAWMSAHLSGVSVIGGTGCQAAQQWAVLGAHALIALEDRSKTQLDTLHPDVLVATETGITEKRSVVPHGNLRKAPHYIFEYQAGESINGTQLARSSRTIVRFADDPLERDPHFERAAFDLAGEAGAGIICGFNEVSVATLDEELDYAAGIARGWRSRGLALVHFEVGDYKQEGLLERSLTALAPAITSLGMSLSESRNLRRDGEDLAGFAVRIGDAFGLSRVCIHADEWAMAATRGDPAVEREALMMGCLLASNRASSGDFTVPRALSQDARFSEPPIALNGSIGGWSIVCCPSPYVAMPAATIGLGDTFLSGVLLVLGAHPHQEPMASCSSPSR